MIIETDNLKYDEQAVFLLRSLYSKYGYKQYKMRKFEEYDLYVRNKDFLISDSVITFTDTNGKLMALKPDVTLSIVKNTKDSDSSVQKVYYDENVYRVSKGTHSYKEIKQAGLECIGDVDTYCVCEVLSLAVKSLMTISESCVVDVSDLAILFALYDYIGLSYETRTRMTSLISDKNTHEMKHLCEDMSVSAESTALLEELISYNGTPDKILPRLKAMAERIGAQAEFSEFESVVSSLDEELQSKLRIDFSVVSDINYYNGIVFKGFIDKIPDSVLSGGRYDSLMQSMSRKSKAIGFAVYIDMLERFNIKEREFDYAAVLLYSENDSISTVKNAAQRLINEYGCVFTAKKLPEKATYGKLFELQNGEVILIENNA
ncbi:MAG: ATP phosphoribosyltransferase regulatory subunit [Ruminococcus sp.]|nr:ATP phosphoribosyltransferase regulatory subunit [Ruminococcus sp.]MDY4910241.1 ATP phosphoribosyltransferase regulatory subunit [Candidatus Fimenecus sp.]